MTAVVVELVSFPPAAGEAEFDSEGERVYATFLEGVWSTTELGVDRIARVCGDGPIRRWSGDDGRRLTVWHRSDYAAKHGPHGGHWHTFSLRTVDDPRGL